MQASHSFASLQEGARPGKRNCALGRHREGLLIKDICILLLGEAAPSMLTWLVSEMYTLEKPGEEINLTGLSTLCGLGHLLGPSSSPAYLCPPFLHHSPCLSLPADE